MNFHFTDRYRILFLSRTNFLLSATRWHSLLPLAGVLLFFLVSPVAFAQKPSSAANPPRTSLQGTITTQNGDVIAGATVKLAKNPPLGSPNTTVTDENGHYEFRNLLSGNFTIFVEGVGFKKAERAVFLKDEEQSVQDFSLNVETVAETVQVTGMASIVTTESSSAPVSVVTNTQLVTLPTSTGTSEGSDSNDSGCGADP